MNTLPLALALFAFLLGSAAVPPVIAGAEEGITPYGAHCGLCGDYGYCTQLTSPGKASRSLVSFYEGKGLKAIVKGNDSRFMEAEIYRGDVMIDKVLLDRKTGRIRSIF